MNIAVIGSGAREHALAWRINKDIESLDSELNLFLIPGNPGTENLGMNVNINQSDNESILKFCTSKNIDLVVIGPETPLVNGLADLLRSYDIPVFGPSQNAARIESEKSYAKQIMQKYSVQTALYKEFSRENIKECKEYIQNSIFPLVVKADGLAAGKGVIICSNSEDAFLAVDSIFTENIFGKAGDKLIIEEFLEGEEASIFAITDGNSFITLPSAQDHKRIWDGDKGKNTGGMGAYSPAPIITKNMSLEIEDLIIKPIITGLKKEGNPFIGCLYCGLIITNEGPKVIEFNCRFGDPETQVVLPLIEGSFSNLLLSTAKGKIEKESVSFPKRCAVCIVAASEGYPEKYDTGFKIEGLDLANNDNEIIFHAGTRKSNDDLITSGGRVLGVTYVDHNNDLKNCIEEAYRLIEKIRFKNIYYRKDIGKKAFSNLIP